MMLCKKFISEYKLVNEFSNLIRYMRLLRKGNDRKVFLKSPHPNSSKRREKLN